MQVTLSDLKAFAKASDRYFKSHPEVPYDIVDSTKAALAAWHEHGCLVVRAKVEHGDAAKMRSSLPPMNTIFLVDLSDQSVLPTFHRPSGEKITSRYVLVFAFDAVLRDGSEQAMISLELLSLYSYKGVGLTYRYPLDNQTMHGWINNKIDGFDDEDNNNVMRVRRIIHDVLNEALS